MDDMQSRAQLEKRIEWLDNEHRNDKTVIAGLQNKIENLGTENSSLRIRITEMESEIARLNTLVMRVEQFELDVSSTRTDLIRQIEEFKNSTHTNLVQIEKNQQRFDGMSLDIIDLQKRIALFDNFSELVDDRKTEDIRLARLIEEVKTQVVETSRFDEEYKRSLRVLEDSIRQDAKRLADFQGEISSIRKRQDEIRGKQDLLGDSMRKLEIRTKEFLDSESLRQEAQTNFMERINIQQVDRDRVFRSWADRFDEMEALTSGLEDEVTGLEETHEAVKKSISAVDEVTQRFDRRINEITEVQRLNEDRFRQEWTTFKSDDQKRWSNYSLAQEEQLREMSRDLTGFSDRITNLEDVIERLRETIELAGSEEIRRLQAQLGIVRESIETYNKIYKQ